MARPTGRPLRIADVVWLVATAAVALAVYRWLTQDLFRHWVWLTERGFQGWNRDSAVWALGWGFYGATMLVPFALAWTVLLPVLRSRPPRPPRRRLWREPGMAACLAAGFATGWAGAAFVLARGIGLALPNVRTQSNERWVQEFVANELFMYVGLAVAAVWAFLAATGQWRRPSDAIERLARVVGGVWIGVGLFWSVHEYVVLI